MQPVVPCVFDEEEDCHMHRNLPGGWERSGRLHSDVDGHRMKEPDLGELDGEVGEQDEGSALPLFSNGRDFVLPCWLAGDREEAGILNEKT